MGAIYLFRHGQTDWNQEGRIQGHLDVPLNDRGRSQIAGLFDPLARLGIQAVLSSDLSRAAESARLVAERLGVPLSTDARLREIHLGAAQGLNRAEIAARFGSALSDRLRSTPLSDEDVRDLACEAGGQVLERSLASIRDFFDAREGIRNIAICSHGGVIRRLIQRASYKNGNGDFPPPVSNAVIFGIEILEEEWKLMPSLPIR